MERSDDVWSCAAGESFDLIALKVYGSEKYASEILSMNPELADKLVFEGGETVTLPVLYIPDETEDDTYDAANPPWKE